MKAHSTVGLISNSSSQIYTCPVSSWEDRLRDVGTSLLTAMGSEASFDDVFEVYQELSGDALDRLFDQSYDFVSEENEDAYNAELKLLFAKYGIQYMWQNDKIPAEQQEAFAADCLALATKYFDGFTGEFPFTRENYNGYSQANYEVGLRVKATGAVIDVQRLFDKVYSQSSCYDG